MTMRSSRMWLGAMLMAACGAALAVFVAGFVQTPAAAKTGEPAVQSAVQSSVQPVVPTAGQNPTQIEWTRDDAAHLLRRAGFGGTPRQIDLLFAMGRGGAVEYLLTGNTPPGAQAPFKPTTLPDFTYQPDEAAAPQGHKKGDGDAAKGKGHGQNATFAETPATQPTAQASARGAPTTTEALEAKKAKQKQKQQQRRQELEELRIWWVGHMVRTDRPLDEKMTLFWSGLFTSGAKEVKDANLLARQNALFHQNALGDYQTLADDIMRDPAMLRYLNANDNVKGKPNENLAREFMELFTMGQGQGYTEKDVGQVARALTGMGVGRNGGVMRPRLHDDGEKTIFGRTGDFGPDDVVKLVFAQPEPAKYLARKLWEFYAYPDPSDADIQPVADALTASHFQIVPALRVMFNSPAFYSEKAKFALIKSPTELVVESMRELGDAPADTVLRPVVRQMKTMGQELFQPPNVKGWPGGEHWITSSTLYTRYNVASTMVNGLYGGRGGGGKQAAGHNAAHQGQAPARAAFGRPPDEGGPVQPRELFANLPDDPTADQLVDAAIARFLQRPLNAAKRQVLIGTLGSTPLHLGEMQTDQRVREMLALLLSTPEYQVH